MCLEALDASSLPHALDRYVTRFKALAGWQLFFPVNASAVNYIQRTFMQLSTWLPCSKFNVKQIKLAHLAKPSGLELRNEQTEGVKNLKLSSCELCTLLSSR